MNILVTGASRGIGSEIVKRFAESSDNIIIPISRNMKNLRTLQGVCKNLNENSNVIPIKFDLISDDYEKDLVPKVLEVVSNVDILINNAGLIVNKPFIETTDNDFESLFQVNVNGPFRLIKHLFPYFSKNSHIVNIGSMGGFQGSMKFPGLAIYSASKGALAILTESLAEELKESGIRINCLALGAAKTEMLMEAFPNYEPPLTAKDISKFICDFACEGNRYFNGKIIPVATTTP